MSDYYAHITNSGEKQLVREHLRKTAQNAFSLLNRINLGNCAYLAGMLHDIGKYKQPFQDYLHRASKGEKVSRGEVVHTFTGVKYILEKYHTDNEEKIYEKITSELLAFAAGAHHGLFDCVDEEHKSGFAHRLENTSVDDEKAIKNFLSDCICENKIEELFADAQEEITQIINNSKVFFTDDEDEFAFFLGLLSRLLLSAVIEGDRRDTIDFMEQREEGPTEVEKVKWGVLLDQLEKKIQKLPRRSEIDQGREYISTACKNFSENPSGVYRLNVPTGSGKTLSCLRYAVAHSKKYNKERIFYVAPLLSIIDQNSEIIHDYISNDKLILEHHSNVITAEDEEDYRNEGLKDNWSAPIIITTLVQLLNSMFDGKTSSIRRFHALANSVIIIDEVQTVPDKLLSMFNLAISFLSDICQATIILCSATQPSTDKLKHPLRVDTKNIVPYEKKLWETFKRTEINVKGEYNIEEIPILAMDVLQNTNSILIVCNKKSQAEKIYRTFQEEKVKSFHLSAAMCMTHRQKELRELEESLEKEESVVCVATQVIEAGVDISFGAVIRFTAGMDRIIQSAGRCNRNGECNRQGQVYIVRIVDEDLSKMPEMQMQKIATEQLLYKYQENPERFSSDLSSEKAVRDYYNNLHLLESKVATYHDCVLKGKPTIFNMLSWNSLWDSGKANSSYYLRQAFASAGKEFAVFDNDSVDVIVPYAEGEWILGELLSERAQKDFAYARKLIKQAKKYVVSIFGYQKRFLEERKGIFPVINGLAIGLDKKYYDDKTGLIINSEEENQTCNTLIV